MDPARAAQIDMQIEKMRVSRALRFMFQVKEKLRDKPEVYNSFLHSMYEYKNNRIGIPDVLERVSNLFDGHPELVKGFCDFLPQSMGTEVEVACEDMEAPRPAKKAKDDSIKPLEPGPSCATVTCSNSSCSANLSHPPNVLVSFPENTVEVCGGPEEASQLERRIVYVSETKQKLVHGPEAYGNFIELIREIRANRSDTYALMERASTLLQGYPELIEGFNKFLPDGFRILILTNNSDMSID